jgi:hypothetical protein
MAWFKRHEEEPDDEIVQLAKHAAELHGVPVQEVVETVLGDDDDEEAEVGAESDEEAPKRRHVGLWITVVCVGIAFGLVIVFFMRLANTADQSGPKAIAGIQAVETSIQPTPRGLPGLKGHYIWFSYPAVFDTVQNLANWPTTAERYIIGSTADYRRQITVTVENNTPEAKDDSGFQFRTDNPSDYTPQSTLVMGEAATIMVKSDGTERTLYWPHAGMLAVVSVTSTSGTDNLAQFMSVIIANMRWAG